MTDEYDLETGPDPAAYASNSPAVDCPPGSEPVVHAVGIGPGNPEYLTSRTKRVLGEADIVVGFETVVEFIRDQTDAECLTCGYRDEADALATFAERVENGDRGTAVTMGDPNHSGYQFVGKVERAVDTATDGAVGVRVLPGISSVQIAASRARTPMEDATFVTLHKSGDLTTGIDRLRRHVGQRHLLVLPRPFDWMPGDIAADLLEHGGNPTAAVLVCERLTHDDEHVTRTTLGNLAKHAGGTQPADSPFSDLSVMVVRREATRGDERRREET